MSETKKIDFTVIPISRNDSNQNSNESTASGVAGSDMIVRYSLSTTTNAPVTSRPPKPTKDSEKKDK